MAHIGKESTLQTARFFGTVFCYAQVPLRYLSSSSFNVLYGNKRKERCTNRAPASTEQSTGRPDLISILLIERNRLVTSSASLKGNTARYSAPIPSPSGYPVPLWNQFPKGLTYPAGGQPSVRTPLPSPCPISGSRATTPAIAQYPKAHR